MAVSTNVIKNDDGTYSIGGVTVREDNGQLQRKWLGQWWQEDNPQIIYNWNIYKSIITPEPETPTTTSSNAPTRAAYSDGAMQARGFKKNAAGNWEKDGVEYDNNGQPIKKAVVVTRPSAQAQGLFSGDLRSYQSRKNWVQEHKDYLKEKGANINWDNYSGTAEQNLALKNLLGGYNAWNEAKKAAAIPAVSEDQRFVNEGYVKGGFQDAELQNMEGNQALYLNKDDYNRYIALKFGGMKPNPYITPVQSGSRAAIQSVASTATLNAVPITPRTGYTNPAPYSAEVSLSSVRPTTVEEVRKQKMQQLAQSNGSIGQAIARMYFSGDWNKYKTGGKINYQKIFK